MDHNHLLVNATFEKTPFTNIDFTKSWIRQLVKEINMEILYAPRAVRCDKKDNEGISAFCLITTSHISLHSCEESDPNLVQLDIYSCKYFDKDVVLKYISNLKPKSLGYKFLDRSNFDNEDLL